MTYLGGMSTPAPDPRTRVDYVRVSRFPRRPVMVTVHGAQDRAHAVRYARSITEYSIYTLTREAVRDTVRDLQLFALTLSAVLAAGALTVYLETLYY